MCTQNARNDQFPIHVPLSRTSTLKPLPRDDTGFEFAKPLILSILSCNAQWSDQTIECGDSWNIRSAFTPKLD